MEETDPKLGFFSEIRKNFILIIGGIVSLTTVIPAFLNQTSDIFGWKNISSGYCAFIIVYFLAPYLFYLLYCRIHNYTGFSELLPQKQSVKLNESRTAKIIAEVSLIAFIFLYLVFPGHFFNEWISILLILVPIGCFGSLLYQYRNEKNIYPFWKEFGMIGSLIVLIFGLFFIGTFRQEQETGLFPYSLKDQQNTFAAFDLRNNLKKGYTDVMDAARMAAYKYRLQAGGYQPVIHTASYQINPSANQSSYFTNVYSRLYAIDQAQELEINFVTDNAAKLKSAVDSLLKYDRSLINATKTDFNMVNQIDETCYGFYNYTVAIQQANLSVIDLKWAKQLKVLQFKSLCWFFFLILLGLCLWFKLQVRFKELPENGKAGQSALIIDNISQVKSLILLLFILIVPWFRQLDAKDVDLEKPFLNISLNGLVNGEYHPPIQVVYAQVKDAAKDNKPANQPIILPDSTKLKVIRIVDTVKMFTQVSPPGNNGPYKYPKLDTLNDAIRSINKNINNLQWSMADIARRTIKDANDWPALKKELNKRGVHWSGNP